MPASAASFAWSIAAAAVLIDELDAGGARMADAPQSSFLETQPRSPATLRTSGAGES
jgi:hypothetical protein